MHQLVLVHHVFFHHMVHVRHTDDRAFGMGDHLVKGHVRKTPVLELRKLGEDRIFLVGLHGGKRALVDRARHQHRPVHRLSAAAHGLAQGKTDDGGGLIEVLALSFYDPRDDLQEIFDAVAGTHRLLGRVIEALRKFRQIAHGLRELCEDGGVVLCLSEGLNDAAAAAPDHLGPVESEHIKVAVRLIGAHAGENVVGEHRRLGHDAVHCHEELQLLQCLFHGLGIGVAACGIGQHAERHADAVLVVAQHLVREHALREHAGHREAVRYRGAPGLGIELIGIVQIEHALGHDAAALHQGHSAYDGQQQTEIAAGGGVPAEVQAEIAVHAPLLRGEDAGKLLRL